MSYSEISLYINIIYQIGSNRKHTHIPNAASIKII